VEDKWSVPAQRGPRGSTLQSDVKMSNTIYEEAKRVYERILTNQGAISGSSFLFLLTVEILIYDSSHESSNRNTLFLRSLFQHRFLVSKDRCSFVSSFV
jgi:hypothetical protein